ncbi:MAG: hypothetical protein WC375_11525 [Methanomassiliicoccales archaeon]|jgi:hypothetical protein
MRKFVVVLVVMVLVWNIGTALGVEITITSPAEIVKNPDFRNCRWGMTISEVKASESNVEWKEFDVINNALEYDTMILNMDCSTSFYFDNQGKLYRGGVWFYVSHSNEFLYYSDYTTVSDSLEKKYGKPYDHIEYWVDDYYGVYQNDKSQWGMAILLGKLVLSTQWETNTTNIMLAMMGDNYEVQFAIIYDDKNAQMVVDTTGI